MSIYADPFTGDTFNTSNWQHMTAQFIITGTAVQYIEVDRVSGDSANVTYGAHWYSGTMGDDHFSKITIATKIDNAAVVCRSRNVNGYYRNYQFKWNFSNGYYFIYKSITGFDSPELTNLYQNNVLSISNGDTMKISVTGAATPTIKIYKNDSIITTVTDSSGTPLSGGRPGFMGYGNALRLDDWEGGDIPRSSPFPFPRLS